MSDTQTQPAPRKARWLAWIGQALLIVILLGAGLAAVGYGLGSQMPLEHTVSAGVIIDASQDDVFAVVNAPAAYPDWRPELAGVTMLQTDDGTVRWREEWSGSQPVELTRESFEFPSRMVVRIHDPSGTFSGTWTISLSADEGGTRVQIDEVGQIPNPLVRFMARRMTPGGPEHYLHLWLTHLAERFGDADPQLIRIEYRGPGG